MRYQETRPIIVENGTTIPFPSTLEGRNARPAAAANDNRRPWKKTLRRSARQIWRVLPPVVGAGMVIYAMTH